MKNNGTIPFMHDSAVSSVIPDAVFRHENDRKARLYLLDVQRNVGLYAESRFIAPSYRPALFHHILSLMTMYAAQPEIQRGLSDVADTAHRQFCAELGFQILAHDDEETLGEPLTFQQKVDPLFAGIDLEKYRQNAPRLNYQIAQYYASCDHFDDYHEIVTSMQKRVAYGKRAVLHGDPMRYASGMQHLFNETLRDLSVAAALAGHEAGGSFDVHHAIDRNMDYYHAQWSQCENIGKNGHHAASGYLTKIFDKNDGFYMAHNREKLCDPSMDGALIERESNILVLKTLKRAEHYLPGFLNSAAQDEVASAYGGMAVRVTMDGIRDYVRMTQPVLVLDDENDPTPDVTESRMVFLEHVNKRRNLLTQRRALIHPLADQWILSNDEIAAKAETIKEFPEYAAYSTLKNDIDYAPEFIQSFDRHLKTLQENPIPRHPAYRL